MARAFFVLAGLAWIFQIPISAYIIWVIGEQIVDTSIRIVKTEVNNAAGLVGLGEPFLLPPRVNSEGNATLSFGPVTVDWKRRATETGQLYMFKAKSTVVNHGPWELSDVGVQCYFSTSGEGGETRLNGSTKISVMPGETKPFEVTLTAPKTDDTSPVVQITCKPGGWIKDTWAAY